MGHIVASNKSPSNLQNESETKAGSAVKATIRAPHLRIRRRKTWSTERNMLMASSISKDAGTSRRSSISNPGRRELANTQLRQNNAITASCDQTFVAIEEKHADKTHSIRHDGSTRCPQTKTCTSKLASNCHDFVWRARCQRGPVPFPHAGAFYEGNMLCRPLVNEFWQDKHGWCLADGASCPFLQGGKKTFQTSNR